MKLANIGVSELAPGQVVELTGKDLANVKFVRSKLSEKVRKDGEEPLTYHHFSVASRGFTIDSNDQDSAELLMDAAKKKTIAVLTLEATEHQVEDTNDEGDPVGTFSMRKSFRFISVVTLEDYKAYSANAGAVAVEEAKYAPKGAAGLTAKEQQLAINDAVALGFANFLKTMQPNVIPAPVAAPVAATQGVA